MGDKERSGCITPRPRKDGSISYQAMFKIKGGKAIVKSFNDPEEARAYLAAIATDLAAQQAAKEEKQRRALLAEAAKTPESRLQQYLDTPIKDALSGFKKCNLSCKRHHNAIPVMLLQAKKDTIRDIKKSWVKTYVDEMRKRKTYRGTPYAYASIVRQIAVLRQALEWQAEEIGVEPAKVPFSTKKMFPRHWEGKRERRLEKCEEKALIATFRAIKSPSRHQWIYLLRLALETGARLQELVGMAWNEIDFDSSFWTIPEHREKTAKRRLVPLTAAAMRAVRMLRLMAVDGNPRAFHMLGSPDSVSGLFGRYTRAAGLVDFHFHDLRHEAISRMVIASPDIFQIMKIVGHSSPEMLARYANLRADELAKALGANDKRRDRR